MADGVKLTLSVADTLTLSLPVKLTLSLPVTLTLSLPVTLTLSLPVMLALSLGVIVPEDDADASGTHTFISMWVSFDPQNIPRSEHTPWSWENKPPEQVYGENDADGLVLLLAVTLMLSLAVTEIEALNDGFGTQALPSK